MNKKILVTMLLMMSLVMTSNFVSAELQLDDVYFDPAIVSAGDSVDVVVQYSVDSVDSNKIANEDYTFDVKLTADDTLTKNYVTVMDSSGDDLVGRVFAGQHYNKVFRVKIADNAPVGDYQFELAGQWYFNGRAVDYAQSKKITMFVKKEGVVLGVSSLTTSPAEVRSGDDFVVLNSYVENAGEKAAKSVEVSLILPEGFKPSYSNNNRVWVGVVDAGASKVATFNVNINDSVEGGVYNFTYNFKYRDSENNVYTKEEVIPFYVKSKPLIEVVKTEGSSVGGSSSKLYVTIKNVGKEDAESVDVRILKQSSQPFDFDIRSDYIGELKSGEEGLAIFDLNVVRGAAVKNYDLKLMIRAKGDGDEGDDNIYVFNRRAKFEVVESLFNVLFVSGLLGLLGVLGYFYRGKITIKKGIFKK